MSIYDVFSDAPNQIKFEGEAIVLVFTRTNNTSGVLSWNIPPPGPGCSADSRAFNGIVITGNTTYERVCDKPVDLTVYTGDPTMDPNLSMGSKLGGTMCVAALYNNVTTTSVTITGLVAGIPYFFNGYAVNNTFHYHFDGVRSYSMPNNPGNITEATPGYHFIRYGNAITSPTDGTNYALGVDYTFAFQISSDWNHKHDDDEYFHDPYRTKESKHGLKNYVFTIPGQDMVTFGDMVNALNRKFNSFSTNYSASVPPNTGAYYYDATTGMLYQWNGYTEVPIPVIVQATPPNAVSTGSYWYQPIENILYIRTSAPAWQVVPASDIITFYHDPTMPACDDIWYNGTQAYQWDGYVWCQEPTYIQTVNPSLPPTLSCQNYWFNTNTGLLMQWENISTAACSTPSTDVTNTPGGYWLDRSVIYAPYNPSTPTTNALWFNSTSNQLFTWNGTDWVQDTALTISDIAPVTPANNDYWYDLINNVFYQYDSTTKQWNAVFVTVYASDITIRMSCDLWLNSSNNELFVWNTETSTWVQITDFVLQATDPSAAPTLAAGSVWVNGTTSPPVLSVWDGTMWTITQYIDFATDPRTPPTGTVWYNTTNKTWAAWSGTAWVPFIPVSSETDPANPPVGTFWFDTANNTLYQWNGTTWVPVGYYTTPVIPTIGTTWYNSANGLLYQWNGTTWIVIVGIANAKLIFVSPEVVLGNAVQSIGPPTQPPDAYLQFQTGKLGSAAIIAIQPPFDVWDGSVPAGAIQVPIRGSDEAPDKVMTEVIGVGTDGTIDDRRKLITELKHQLGWPTTQVELYPGAIDTAIDVAFRELRMRSSSANKREFFFLKVKPGQYTYSLTDKTNGLNRINMIAKITRQRAGFTGRYDNLIFSHSFIQDLYHMGTYDLVTFDASAQYTKMLERLFASDVMYTFNEHTRLLVILQNIQQPELFLMESSVERTEQEILKDRFIYNWVQRWSLAEMLEMLSRIRGKYTSLPGPSGNVTMNSSDLYQQATTLKEKCYDDIDQYVSTSPDEWVGDIMYG